MTRQRLLKLIQESRSLLAEATPEQKIKLLRLIKESYERLKENENTELPYFLVESHSAFVNQQNKKIAELISSPFPKFPNRSVFDAISDPRHKVGKLSESEMAEYVSRHLEWKTWKNKFDEFSDSTSVIKEDSESGNQTVDNIYRLNGWRHIFLESVGVKVEDKSVATVEQVKQLLKKYFNAVIDHSEIKPGMLVDAIIIRIDRAPKEVEVSVHSSHTVRAVKFIKSDDAYSISTVEGLGPLPSSWSDDLTDLEVIFVEKANTAAQQITALALEVSGGWNGWNFSLLDDEHEQSNLTENCQNADYLEEK
jgi:hypothetical protein